MSNHPYFSLTIPCQAGTLLLTPCPGTADADLAASITTLREAGAEAVLTLMSETELRQNGVEQLPEHCQDQGVDWFHLPIDDDGAPAASFTEAWQQVRAKVHHHLDEGHAVAIHCKGGSGRTGLVAGQILVEHGVKVVDAISRVQAVRPKAFQRTAHQDYIQEIAAAVKA